MEAFVYGASGHAGAQVVASLTRAGVPLVAAGRNARRVADALRAVSPPPQIRAVDLGDAPGLVRAIGRAQIVVNCAGPSLDTGTALLDAATRRGAHYVDISNEPRFVDAVLDRSGDPGVVAPACGARGTLGAWGAQLCVDALGGSADEIVVGVGIAPSSYLRPSVAAWLGAAGHGFYRDGGPRGEFPRRCVLPFPPPFGTGVALQVPCADEVTIARTLGLDRVRGYVALAPGQPLNELWARWEVATGRAIPTLARVLSSAWGRMHMHMYFPGPPREPVSETFAMVVIAHRRGRTRGVGIVARDAYDVTCAIVSRVVQALAEGALGRGARPCLLDPTRALRALERDGVVRVVTRDD